MQYLRRTTLQELTGLDQPRHIREKARELLELLEKGRTAEPVRPDRLYCDDVSILKRPSL